VVLRRPQTRVDFAGLGAASRRLRDFTGIAAFMRESGAPVARSLDVKPSYKVLDLGCGDGVADATFDLSLSVFGAMFAPRPLDVAKETVRVTKPGGRIVMGNWIPNDPESFWSC
jgi:SAM-dependent methyltransferase